MRCSLILRNILKRIPVRCSLTLLTYFEVYVWIIVRIVSETPRCMFPVLWRNITTTTTSVASLLVKTRISKVWNY